MRRRCPCQSILMKSDPEPRVFRSPTSTDPSPKTVCSFSLPLSSFLWSSCSPAPWLCSSFPWEQPARVRSTWRSQRNSNGQSQPEFRRILSKTPVNQPISSTVWPVFRSLITWNFSPVVGRAPSARGRSCWLMCCHSLSSSLPQWSFS